MFDEIREFAKDNGWTPNNVLCSYDYVKNMIPWVAYKESEIPEIQIINYFMKIHSCRGLKVDNDGCLNFGVERKCMKCRSDKLSSCELYESGALRLSEIQSIKKQYA